MTRTEVDDAMTNDFLDQQAGLDIDPLQVQDVRVDHNPEFFDTMLARTYVGYGASSLGVDIGFSNPQPRSTLDSQVALVQFYSKQYRFLVHDKPLRYLKLV